MEKTSLYAKHWRERHPRKWRRIRRRWKSLYARRYRAKLRKDILQAYGALCVVCGETKKSKLVLDHINGDGKQHRKARRRRGIYVDVRRQGFPKDKYRILCIACNTRDWYKRFYRPPGRKGE